MLRELFGGGAVPEWEPIDLPRLVGTLLEAARAVESKPADREMIFVRLCDAYRAMDLDLPGEKGWEAAVAGKPAVWPPSEEVAPKLRRPLAAEGWKRLHVLVESLQDKGIWELVRQRSVDQGTERVSLCLFLGLAQWAELLTIELLLKSTFRLEELARKWVEILGGTIAGEDAKKSARRLRDLDYGQVLGHLENAQRSRAEHQRRMQAELERRRREEYERTQRE